MDNYYATLEVAETASAAEIKLAYRRLSKHWHPDLNPGNKQAEEKIKEINRAYDVLSDPYKRSHYDSMLQYARQAPEPQAPQPETYTQAYTQTADNSFYKKYDKVIRMVLGAFLVVPLIAGAIGTCIINQKRKTQESSWQITKFVYVNEKGDSVFIMENNILKSSPENGPDQLITLNSDTITKNLPQPEQMDKTALQKALIDFIKSNTKPWISASGKTIQLYDADIINDYLVLYRNVDDEYGETVFFPLADYGHSTFYNDRIIMYTEQSQMLYVNRYLQTETYSNSVEIGLKNELSLQQHDRLRRIIGRLKDVSVEKELPVNIIDKEENYKERQEAARASFSTLMKNVLPANTSMNMSPEKNELQFITGVKTIQIYVCNTVINASAGSTQIIFISGKNRYVINSNKALDASQAHEVRKGFYAMKSFCAPVKR